MKATRVDGVSVRLKRLSTLSQHLVVELVLLLLAQVLLHARARVVERRDDHVLVPFRIISIIVLIERVATDLLGKII